MQLAEELGAAPVWVINNGISHREDTPIPNIGKWVQVPPTWPRAKTMAESVFKVFGV